MMFSQQPQALCWMALPLPWENLLSSQTAFPGLQSFQPNTWLPPMPKR
jgi:hypothetical protein